MHITCPQIFQLLKLMKIITEKEIQENTCSLYDILAFLNKCENVSKSKVKNTSLGEENDCKGTQGTPGGRDALEQH